jgi:Reverse transcriptase (RNA-dependent DNA polymerase)
VSPVLLVKKKTRENRFLVDFRRLNSQTVREHFPLPYIDDQLSSLSQCNILTVLDLAHGYLQIPLSETAKEKTSFITQEETGQFERLIFGLTNGPAVFQQMMNRILGPLRNLIVVCFLDDILIYARDWSDMLDRLRQELRIISEAKLTLKIKKCEFGKKQLDYLGFFIGNGNLQPGLKKVN